jgi:threonine synthase
LLYVSTRGRAPALDFGDVTLAGLASDGGLYVPDAWPRLTAADLDALRDLDYPALAARLLGLFARPAFDDETLSVVCADAYRGFDHGEVAPLRRLDDRLWLMELFHGPTLAFKDLALQVLGRLFDLILKRRGERLTIVGATSGDTGSAAIEACRDREALEIFILHPKGRVSDVQRRQMTTVTAANVHNIAVEGTFDDCQNLVKAMFADRPFRDRWRLSAVNSINWARIAAQVVYYVFAALRLGAPAQPVAFAVPTGNFGNVFAAFAARAIGLPVAKLVIGSNRNDILTRFFESGRMEVGPVHPTISPSMDIQISSNFERYLFELVDRDAAAVRETMEAFRRDGRFTIAGDRLARAREVFAAFRLDDAETRRTIADLHRATGMVVDPHTAIGVAAGRDWAATHPDVPVVAMATAHPAKFADAVAAATGSRPAMPPRLALLFERKEHCVTLPADLDAIERHIDRTLAERRVEA